MRRATFLTSVRADFRAILSYVADQSGNFAVAKAFVRRLRAQCHRVAVREATVGRARSKLRLDIRSFPYRGYVIFVRYVEGRFEVHGPVTVSDELSKSTRNGP